MVNILTFLKIAHLQIFVLYPFLANIRDKHIKIIKFNLNKFNSVSINFLNLCHVFIGWYVKIIKISPYNANIAIHKFIVEVLLYQGRDIKTQLS